jgi:hypothetical protein
MKKDIIRFNNKKPNIVLFRGVTEEQAREWCNSPYTKKGQLFFDEFAQTDTHLIGKKPKYVKYFTPSEGNI